MQKTQASSNSFKFFCLLSLLISVFLAGNESHAQIKLGGSALDPTFGNQGKMLDHSIYTDSRHLLGTQADGKIVMFNVTNHSYYLTRFNQDGTLDLSFGNGGRLVAYVDTSGSNEALTNAVLQPDGKMLAFGYSQSSSTPSLSSLLLKRFNNDGSVDTSFGNNGSVTTRPSSAEQYNSNITKVLVQPDGKPIVVVTLAENDGTLGANWFMNTNIVAFRYLPDGSLDGSFSNGGKLFVDIPARKFSTALCSQLIYGADMPYDATLQPDGKLVIVGMTQSQLFTYDRYQCSDTYPPVGIAASSFTVIRVNQNGTLDTSFNNSGMVNLQSSLPALNWQTSWPYVNGAFKVYNQPNGKLLVLGELEIPNSQNLRSGYLRINNDGSFDNNFGNSGMLNTDYNLAVEPDGKILTRGTTGSFFDAYFAIARYSADGVYEETLSPYLPRIPISRQLRFNHEDILVQSDGKILVQGYKQELSGNIVYKYLTLMRLLPHPANSASVK